MKTILIPLTKPPRDFCEYLETLGIYKLKRDSSETSIGAPIYIKNISSQPETVSPFKHIWIYNKYLSITHHRINLTEEGEQILKDNGIKFEYE